MSDHTPGEWTARGRTVYGPNGEVICFTALADPEANARLIAVAPKLLALCESFAGLGDGAGMEAMVLDQLDVLCERANRTLKEIKG